MFKKATFLGTLAGFRLVLGAILGAISPLHAAEFHTRETIKSTPFQRIEQPLSNKMAVTLGGLGLIGLELWWFLLSKPKSRPATTLGGIQEVTIIVDGGYEPSQIAVQVGQPVRLNFYRKDASSCLEEVRLPDFHIARELPLNQTIPIEFTPDKPGNYEFTCGMNMFRGRIEVQSEEVAVPTPPTTSFQGSSSFDSIPLTEFRENLSKEVLDSKG